MLNDLTDVLGFDYSYLAAPIMNFPTTLNIGIMQLRSKIQLTSMISTKYYP